MCETVRTGEKDEKITVRTGEKDEKRKVEVERRTGEKMREEQLE